MADTEQAARDTIVWNSDEHQPSSSKHSLLEEEQEKHKRRAAKFGTGYVDPTKRRDLALEVKKQRMKRDGFKTGFDVFSQQELDKKQQRAERFKTDAPVLEYKPPQEELKKQQRAARFGTTYNATDMALMDMDLFASRRDVAPEVERRPEAIHLYGVDVMGTSDVLQYFEDYSPTFVEWLDDSSCNVLFEEANTCRRAVVGMGQPLPQAQQGQGTGGQGLDPTDISNLTFLWHKGKPFSKSGTSITLLYRMATVSDVKSEDAAKTTRALWKQAGSPVMQRKRAPRQQGKQRQQGRGERGQQFHHDDNGAGPSGDGYGDGDATMRRPRRERGGKRMQRRKNRMDEDQYEEEYYAEEEYLDAMPQAPHFPGVDLRLVLSQQHSTLFSANSAGVRVPAMARPMHSRGAPPPSQSYAAQLSAGLDDDEDAYVAPSKPFATAAAAVVVVGLRAGGPVEDAEDGEYEGDAMEE